MRCTLKSFKAHANEGVAQFDNSTARRQVPRLAQIDRMNGKRFFDI